MERRHEKCYMERSHSKTPNLFLGVFFHQDLDQFVCSFFLKHTNHVTPKKRHGLLTCESPTKPGDSTGTVTRGSGTRL